MSDDEELVRASLSGDPEAFRQLVERHRTRVFALASRFTRDTHHLDDLAQEIFLKIWQRLGQYRAEAPFPHWLAKVAIHTCYDFIRRQQRGWFGRLFPLEEADPIPAPAPDESAEAARDRLECALARLRPKEQLVLTLLELEGHSVREVADLTGWSEANVKVRAFRARNALRQWLTLHPEATDP